MQVYGINTPGGYQGLEQQRSEGGNNDGAQAFKEIIDMQSPSVAVEKAGTGAGTATLYSLSGEDMNPAKDVMMYDIFGKTRNVEAFVRRRIDVEM